jgi:hypothetical protein
MLTIYLDLSEFDTKEACERAYFKVSTSDYHVDVYLQWYNISFHA